MSILETIKKRRSIRRFQNKPIPKELIDQLKEALIWAPSAGNLQARKFYFIFNPKVRNKLAEAALGQSFIKEAPLLIVCCADSRIEKKYGKQGKELYAICDVAMSVQNLLLLAADLGLGGVPVGAFDEEGATEILNLPSRFRPILIVPLGYPAEQPSPPSRVSQAEAVEEIH